MPAPTSTPLWSLRSPGREAERTLVERFAATAGSDPLDPAGVTLPSGSRVQIDGVARDESIFVEAHALSAPIRDIDLAVIAQDVFKLSLVKNMHPQARVVVLLADEQVRALVTSRLARVPCAASVEFIVI
ncbi:hypothetical protein [Gephyromycinifex aptenodytis]|uniref:hypothetical protein n=1 Tax=Gephyromycinifex aptenodytis TaxID=2716227 RepID=UPI0014469A08|nr:hypothetical protein [Gephyromycinifex aptenodytis]